MLTQNTFSKEHSILPKRKKKPKSNKTENHQGQVIKLNQSSQENSHEYLLQELKHNVALTEYW